VTSIGDPVIALYPRPTVRIEGVVIADADGSGRPFVTVEQLTGTVRLLPLLLGRPRSASSRGPTIALASTPRTVHRR
jgi:uncharacterized protein involved in outer membrane biogenesis